MYMALFLARTNLEIEAKLDLDEGDNFLKFVLSSVYEGFAIFGFSALP